MEAKQIRKKNIQLRLNDEEFLLIKQRALDAALNLSDYLRFCLFQKANKFAEIEPGRAVLIAGMMELTEIATTLRHIVRQQQAGSRYVNDDLLTSTLAQLKGLSLNIIKYLDRGSDGKK